MADEGYLPRAVSQTSLVNSLLHELPCSFSFNLTQIYLAPSYTATTNITITARNKINPKTKTSLNKSYDSHK
jgi:hypothetical protein